MIDRESIGLYRVVTTAVFSSVPQYYLLMHTVIYSAGREVNTDCV
jgi:hypothetical protein